MLMRDTFQRFKQYNNISINQSTHFSRPKLADDTSQLKFTKYAQEQISPRVPAPRNASLGFSGKQRYFPA